MALAERGTGRAVGSDRSDGDLWVGEQQPHGTRRWHPATAAVVTMDYMRSVKLCVEVAVDCVGDGRPGQTAVDFGHATRHSTVALR